MARYVEGGDRKQVALLPECLEDYIAEENPVRVVDAFVASWIWKRSESPERRQRPQAGRRTTRQCC